MRDQTSIFISSTTLKPSVVWIITNCGKLLKRPSYLSPEKPVCESRSNSQNLVWKNRLVQDWERRITRLFIVTCLFNLHRAHHAKCQAWCVTSWNQDCWEKYQQPQKWGWYHSNGRKQRGMKERLDEAEGGGWKSQLKTQYWENGIETCIISCMKRVHPVSMHDTGCLGLVHWDDPEGGYGVGGGRRV